MPDTERGPNALSLLASLVDRPATALAEIAAYPRWRWVLPVLLLAGALVASVALTSELTAEQAQRAVRQRLAALPAEQAEMARAQIDRLQDPRLLMAMAIGSRLLGLVLSWLMASAILYFGMLVAGGDVSYSGLFATLPWAWLPFALRDAVQTAWILYRGRLVTNPGLSYLVSTGSATEDAMNMLYNALSYADLFVLWHLGLIFVVLWVLPRFSRAKAFVLALVYAALSLGLRLLPTVLGRSLMGGMMG